MMSWVDIMQNAAAEEEETRNIPVQRLEQLYLVVLNIYLSSLISNINHNFLELMMQNSNVVLYRHGLSAEYIVQSAMCLVLHL